MTNFEPISANGCNFSNFGMDERAALRNLKADRSIVIKEADKGSGVVVWDKEDYILEASNQLGDSNVYLKLDTNPSEHLQKVIDDAISIIRERGDMDEKTLEYFLVNDPKLGRFYLLPKIHKRLNGVPGRPIISNSGYFTENISEFLDHHLQPLAKKVPSYIKDTNHFLQKLDALEGLPQDAILYTVDVVGLYPSIPHDEGLESIREALNSRGDFLNSAHHSIKFTAEYSKETIHLLDVQVIKKDDRIVTDLYTKPTDTHQLLHHSSCHPNHTKRGIPYGQALASVVFVQRKGSLQTARRIGDIPSGEGI